MSDGSKIGWLAMPGYRPASWNPLRATAHGGSARQGVSGWACERISPGCQRCYAEALNQRLGTGEAYSVGAPVDHVLDARVLAQPLSWRCPRMIFPCSMTDLFGSWVTDEQIAAVFAVMAATPLHRYVVLTKRAERMRRWVESIDSRAAEMGGLRSDRLYILRGAATKRLAIGAWPTDVHAGGMDWPLPNVLIGPSVEDQQRADERMPHAIKLAECGWRVVVSYEPALGPVDWRDWLRGADIRRHAGYRETFDGIGPSRVAWLLAGAESGKDRREFSPSWIPVAACADARVPLFVKQGSAFKPGQQGDLPDDVWAVKQFPPTP